MRKFLFLAVLLASTPALSQQQSLDSRVTRVEKELRAVQRKVFPGANPDYFDPEISAQPAPVAPVGTPANGAVTDLTARVDALEHEVQRLTAQSEQNGYQLRQLQDQFNQFKAQADAERAAAAAAVAPAPGAASTVPNPFAAQQGAAPADEDAAAPRPRPSATTAAPVATEAPAAPPAVASTGDAAEDAYMAGYRLWEAKRYPDAIAALQVVVDKYPRHKRASYAQNLIGRAYLDDKKPALAAKAFYANYQGNPRGERAPDSLYYLGQSLTQLKKPAEACKVYAELDDVYGAKIGEPLKGRVKQAQADAKCGS